MTSIYEQDPDILNRRNCVPIMKFLGQGFPKLEPEQDRQTDRQMRPNALPCHIHGAGSN